MSASTVKQRNGLQPLATAITWVFWFAVLATGLRVILALFGQRPAFVFGGPAGQPPAVCLETAPPLLRHAGSGLSQAGLSPGVHATWNAANICTAHPTAGQALAFAVTLLPIDLLRLGVLYLVMRLARTVARDGAYAAQAARLVLVLGWWLLAGELAATFAEGFARVNLLGQLVTWNVDWVHQPASWGVSWPVAWFGLGLIIFARVMRVSAGMHADLEGTV
jgi:hypothetical protein